MPRVVFHPDSRTAEVPRGERLLTAAWKAGVGIKSVCGGRGKCGSCLVEVDAAATSSDALTPLTEAERALLPADSRGHDYRLACLCDVRDDVAIAVPPESQAVRSAPRKPYTVTRVAARPIVTRVTAAIEPARKLVNRTFLVAAMGRGMDAAIVDPTDAQLMAAIHAAEAVLGRDEYCMGFIEAFRDGRVAA